MGSCSPAGIEPFCAFNLGEPFLLDSSTDRMEEGCEAEEAVVDLATETGGVLAMISRSKGDDRVPGELQCTMW